MGSLRRYLYYLFTLSIIYFIDVDRLRLNVETVYRITMLYHGNNTQWDLKLTQLHNNY